MVIVHNDDRPGMIAQVATALAEAEVNVSDFHVGRSPTGAAALMAIATDAPIAAAVVERVAAMPGIQMARAIVLE
jgi:D-3-phosphoglycerate dehydrogenase / 2-oxoglutarate reductase